MPNKNTTWYFFISLLVILLGNVITSAIVGTVAYLVALINTTATPNLVDKLSTFSAAGSWALLLAPFSLLITFPIIYKLGQHLTTKRHWQIGNPKAVILLSATLYTLPLVILLLLNRA